MGILILALLVLCLSIWGYRTRNNDTLEAMCQSSVTAALESFRAYRDSGNESNYISGVAEFRTYMTAYLCLLEEGSTADYIWCNILYGDMTLNPEKVKAHIPELVEALEYLVEDYDHPNGFNLINELNNRLRTE